MRLAMLSAALILGGGLSAQSFYIPGNTPGTGTCFVIPFGTSSSNPTWANQRYQTVVRAADLGSTVGRIRGLAFAACGNGTRKHATIDITMSHVQPGYTLSTTFTQNLPTPVVVLSAKDHTWDNSNGSWSFVGLQSVFRYDGTSDVVIDIQVTGSDFPNSGNTFHADTRPRLWATGWTGSPPASGTLDQGALKMCISTGDAMISLHGTGCAGLALGVNGSARLGSTTLDITASGGAASRPIALNAGQTNSGSFPISLGQLGFTGCLLYTDVLASATVTTTASGTATFSLAPVPTKTGLVGARIYVQWLHLDPAAPGGGSASNYARIVFGN